MPVRWKCLPDEFRASSSLHLSIHTEAVPPDTREIMSFQQQMAGVAAKLGPKELAAAGGLLAAVTLYWAGSPVQEVQALEKKPYPEHVPGRTAKLQRRPSWEAKFTGTEEQGQALAAAGKAADAAAKTRLHRRPSWEGKFERHEAPARIHAIRTSIMGTHGVRTTAIRLSSHPLRYSGAGETAQPVPQQYRHPTERSGDPVREPRPQARAGDAVCGE